METNPDLLYLAPFQGITDYIFRSAFATHFGGLDAVFTPYLANSPGGKVNPRKLRDFLPQNNEAIKTIPQILSKDAVEMITMANEFSEMGYKVMNWNLGCPFPQVAKKMRGSGLLPHPDFIKKIMDEVIPAISIGLSVKTRVGYHEPDEIFKLMEVLNQYPIDEIIIHPRTGVQLYRGFAQPDDFEACIHRTSFPLAYNGDIFTPENFNSLKSRFPNIKRWMIGRGALRNPFLPYAIKYNSLLPEKERRTALENFSFGILEDSLARKQEITHILDHQKALWQYLSYTFDDRTSAFRRIRKVSTIEAFRPLLRGIIRNDALAGFIALTDTDPMNGIEVVEG
ncbi:MAG: tRNA-dihydrouridine synthase family protein [Bacteroidales bacterium]|nr:tRNA-dihydrouridine synthase family protein [Bacteroidales bacterium]